MMKKIFAAFIVVMSVFGFINTAYATVLFFDNVNPYQSGWTTSGVVYAGTIGGITSPVGNPYGVIWSGPLVGDSYIQRVINTNNYHDINLEYYRRTYNAEGVDHLLVDWSLNGSAWQNLESISQVTNWGPVSFNLSSLNPAVNNSSFYLRYTMDNGNLWNINPLNLPDYGLIDNVRVTGSIIPEPASLAFLGLGLLGVVRKLFRKAHS